MFKKFLTKLKNRRSSRQIIKDIAKAIPAFEQDIKDISTAVPAIEQEIKDISKVVPAIEDFHRYLDSKLSSIDWSIKSKIDEKFNSRNAVTEELCQIHNTLNVEQGSKLPNNKNRFLLFHYALHMPIFHGHGNLGDYVQTIATKNALLTIFGTKTDFDFWDRDCLSFYSTKESEKITCIMQAWLSHTQSFFPSNTINPIWLGTHFERTTRNYLEKVFCIKRTNDLFKYDVGCRDLTTLSFCKKHKINAYLSRCLTLTLPKRPHLASQTKVFLVNVPSDWEQFIPNELIKKAERVNQRWQYLEHEHWADTYKRTEQLLAKYINEAELVITTALHVASPCLAMGIPVILIADNPDENFQRFSALTGLITPYTVKELQERKVNFNPGSFDIEDLKENMLKNLELTIRQSWGESISCTELQEIREFIRQYKL